MLAVKLGINCFPTAPPTFSFQREYDPPIPTHRVLVEFLQLLYRAYSDLFFTYLEINPLVVQGNTVYMLDLAAKLDSTAEYLCKVNWGKIDFPPPFGRDALPEVSI